MNDGTLGNPTSNASTRANVDVWQLYNLIWTMAKPYDTGSTFNAIAQMYTSGGVAANYGGSAIGDFNANKALALTQMMGRIVMGTAPDAAVIAQTWNQTFTASNSAGALLITASTTVFMFKGQPVSFTTTGTLPGNIVANAIYYVTLVNVAGANTFQVATTYANALAGTPVVAFTTTGANSTLHLDGTGTITGEYQHTQLLAELATHTHTIANSPNAFFQNAGAPGLGAGATINQAASITLNTAGNSLPFNVVQPSVFYNIFMKL